MASFLNDYTRARSSFIQKEEINDPNINSLLKQGTVDNISVKNLAVTYNLTAPSATIGNLNTTTLTVDSLDATFDISAATANFTSTVDVGGDLTVTGTVSGSAASFTSTVNANSLDVGTDLTVTGTVSGSTATFTSTVNVDSLDATFDINAATANFTSTVDVGGNLTVTGTVSSNTLAVGDVTSTGTISCNNVDSMQVYASESIGGQNTSTTMPTVDVSNLNNAFTGSVMVASANRGSTNVYKLLSARNNLTTEVASIDGTGRVTGTKVTASSNADAGSYTDTAGASIGTEGGICAKKTIFCNELQSKFGLYSEGYVCMDSQVDPGQPLVLFRSLMPAYTGTLLWVESNPDSSADLLRLCQGGSGQRLLVNSAGDLTSAGVLKNTQTAQSTSTTTGALITAGGLGCAKNAYIGGDLNVTGNTMMGGIRRPMFYVTRNGSAGETISSTTIPWNNIVINVGSHYTTTGNKFVAPVAGYYQSSFYGLNGYGANTDWNLHLRKNAATYYQAYTSEGAISFTVMVQLAIGDYVDTFYNGLFSGHNHNYFSGHLLELL